MTTQVPPAQSGYPPAPTYSTAPPWASPAEQATVGRDATVNPAAPFEAVVQHGQLLVPYPEEMAAAGRTKPPAWWPVVAFTFVFGIGGLMSAIRRATQARQGKNSQAPYWLAFGVTVALMFGMLVLVTPIAVPVYLEMRERAVLTVLQDNLVKDGKLTATAHVTATSAQCEALGTRRADGLRRYTCLLRLDDGRTGTIDVTADEDGTWNPVLPQR